MRRSLEAHEKRWRATRGQSGMRMDGQRYAGAGDNEARLLDWPHVSSGTDYSLRRDGFRSRKKDCRNSGRAFKDAAPNAGLPRQEY